MKYSMTLKTFKSDIIGAEFDVSVDDINPPDLPPEVRNRIFRMEFEKMLLHVIQACTVNVDLENERFTISVQRAG